MGFVSTSAFPRLEVAGLGEGFSTLDEALRHREQEPSKDLTDCRGDWDAHHAIDSAVVVELPS